MSITGGVSWEEVLGPLKAISFVWVVLYLFYIAFTHLGGEPVVQPIGLETLRRSDEYDCQSHKN